MEKKPWYKSKIAMLAYAGAATIGANLLTGFITGNGVTPEQIQVVAETQPAIADAIQDVRDGQNIIGALSTVAFLLIGVFRVWFTNKVIG